MADNMPRAKARTSAVPGTSDVKVIDPTENVKALMAASLEALAELRRSDKELVKLQFKHVKEITKLRAAHAALLRTSDLTTLEKTRQVDVLAGAASAASLATAVSALQATTDRNTETLRNQVADTAQAMAKQTAESATAVQTQTDNLFRRTEAAINVVSDRVGALERQSAAGAGRQSVVDPQITELLSEMKRLVVGRSTDVGKTEGSGDVWKWLLMGVAALGTLVGIGGAMTAVILFVTKG